MSSLQGTPRLGPVGLIFRKCKSTKTDTVSLASALGLLSPSKDISRHTPYKPSLFRNLQKGSVLEEFADLRNQPTVLDNPKLSHQNSMASLMTDLQNASECLPWTGEPPAAQHLKAYVKTLNNEAELLHLLRTSYMNKQLSLQLLMQYLLNRSLQDLSKLPFDVANINHTEFEKHGWSKHNFCELKILLMKKYHDLKQPLEIVKLLKSSFETELLPLIKAQQLSPFYERIAWKFYFEYLGIKKEVAKIDELGSLRSSFLIWEATTAQNSEILQRIQQKYDLNNPQSVFMRVALDSLVQQTVADELAHGRSALLSGLKQISAKFKIYKITQEDNVTSRAYMFSLIHKLEDLLQSRFKGDATREEIELLLQELTSKRRSMVDPVRAVGEFDHLTQYAH